MSSRLVATNFVSILKHAWPDSWGPRLQYILGNATRTVAAAPDRHRPTLLGLPRVLVDQRYRDELLRYVRDGQTLSFWRDEFEQWPARQVAEALEPRAEQAGGALL